MHTSRGPRAARFRAAAAMAVLVALVPLSSSTSGASTTPSHFQPTPITSWRADGVGWATLVVGNRVYVGGDFPTVRSPDSSSIVTRANLAAFDVNTGVLISTFTANTNGIVRALATDGTRLFVGGSFTTVNGVSRQRLAALDPVTGAVDSGWVAHANSNVYALGVGGGHLIVGGSFSNIRGASRRRVASLGLADGAVTSFAPNVDNTVSSLTVDPAGTRVYIGGPFSTVNGAAAPWLAKLDASGSLIPVVWDQLQGPALDVELNEDGTSLAVAQGGAGNQGSWFNAETGQRIWRQRCDGDAQAIHIIDGTMFTGFHEACELDTTQRLTANITSNGARDGSFEPTFDVFWGVRAIDGNAGNLVVAGDFTNISGVAIQGFAIFPYRYVPPPPVSMVDDATWRYLDDGSSPPAAWTRAGFDDSGWRSGPAELGYGDGDESTVIGYGPNASAKYITSYFRSTFQATEVPLTVSLNLLADDGAVVYVNGAEVARDNMPTGAITSTTRAATGRSGSDETVFRTFAIPPAAISVGTNTIAVEVHQDAPSSSDLSFAAALTSTGNPTPPPTTTTAPTTTTTAPTTTTTLAPTTTTTTAPTTTTTVPPTGTTIFTDRFDGADGAPWTNWITGTSAGTAAIAGGAGRLSFTDTANAYARGVLSAVADRADSSTLVSYQWSSTTAAAYFNVYVRGSGGWQNAYRPRSGYGLELTSSSAAVAVRKNVNGTTTTIRSVTAGQAVTTQKQWLRLRVVGSTIQFRTWVDGQAEPTTWRSTDSDASVSGPGQLYVSLVRSSTDVGAKAVSLDDLVIADGS